MDALEQLKSVVGQYNYIGKSNSITHVFLTQRGFFGQNIGWQLVCEYREFGTILYMTKEYSDSKIGYMVADMKRFLKRKKIYHSSRIQ